jgi:hypothetical protein
MSTELLSNENLSFLLHLSKPHFSWIYEDAMGEDAESSSMRTVFANLTIGLRPYCHFHFPFLVSRLERTLSVFLLCLVPDGVDRTKQTGFRTSKSSLNLHDEGIV